MDTATAPRIALLVPTDATFLRRVCEGAVNYARTHTTWRLMGLGLGISESAVSQPRVDGAIVNGPVEALAVHGLPSDLPCVHVGTMFAPWDRPMSFPDHWKIGELAAEYFLGLELPHLAFSGERHGAYAKYRYEAFAATAAKHGIEVHYHEYPLVPDPNSDQWNRAMGWLCDWLLSLPVPCGVLGCDDRRAAQITVAAERCGRAIPDELAVLGVNDDDLLCSVTTPRLSSISFSGFDVGYTAAAMLAEILAGGQPNSPVLIPPDRVVARESTAYLPIADDVVRRALRRIRAEAPIANLTVDELVAELPISRRNFHRRFREATGLSPKGEILRTRLDHAQRLLRETDLGIGEIARQMGFPESQDFSRFFRGRTGQAPSEYRKQQRRQEH